MKKLAFMLVVVLVIGIVGASFAYAEDIELEKISDPDERFELFLDRFEQKHIDNITRIEERYDEFVEFSVKSKERTLKVVGRNYEEMSENFTLVLEEHSMVHASLSNLHISLRTDFYNSTVTEVTELFNELKIDLEAGTITYKELLDELKAYTKGKVDEHKEIIENYREAISEEVENDQIRREQMKECVEVLKVALKAKDIELIQETLDRMYELRILHNEIDQYKLSVLESITF